MRKCLFIIVLLINPLLVQAQALYGEWSHAQSGYTLSLQADGQYVFQGPNLYSQGAYRAEDGRLRLQDAANGVVVDYGVQALSDAHLVLTDANNISMSFQRAPSAAAFLAQAGGLTLTTAHVDVGVALAQFIIGQSLKPTEIEALQQQSVLEFQQQPQAFLQEINDIDQSLQQLRTLTDPLQIGLARQTLFATLYLATEAMPETQKPLLIQLINRYVDVLATDAANQLVLTAQDADGVVNYFAFVYKLAGQPVTVTDQQKAQYRAELAQNFAQLPLEQKQFLASASLIWELLEYNWQQLNASQRAELRQQLLASVPAQSAPVAPATTTPGTATAADVLQKQQEIWHQQQMWDMMNNMSLQNHATTLNIIENIGGTGNYWEVTTNPW